MKLKITKFSSVKSTNDEAIKMIKHNKLRPGIIVATNQSKGRGTMGKKWISQKGNLFISIFFNISRSNIKSDKFSVFNPYIIKDVLKKYSKYKIIIKWPNDLIIKKRKLCGILQEVISYKNQKYLIIGVGINTFVSPRSRNFKSISLLKCSKIKIKNNEILMQLKLAYEKFITNTYNRDYNYLKKTICKI